MKKRTGKMISLSLAVAMAVTAAPVTALAEDNVKTDVIEAPALTPADPTEGTTTEGEATTAEEPAAEEGTAWAELTPAEKVEEEVADSLPMEKLAEAAETEEDAEGATIDNAESLQKALDAAKGAEDKVVALTHDITIDKAITIPTGVTLDGDGSTITVDDSVEDHAISVVSAKDVTIKSLTVTGSQKSGIHVWGSQNVTLNNVTIKDSAHAGLLINGSTVEATDLKTSDNVWGAVNVDKGSTDIAPTFTLNGDCDLAEANKVWSEQASKASITINAVNDWVTMNTTGDDNMTYYTDLEDVNDVLAGIVAKDEDQNDYGKATVTLNKNVTVSNEDVKDSKTAPAVTLPANVTLDGAGKTIEADEDWEPENTNHILGVTNGNVTIKNVTIVGNAKTKSGIVAWQGSGSNVTLNLEGVTINDCGNAALQVSSATVNATNLKTSGNSWGAVNVDKASGNDTNTPSFTLSGDNSELSESTKVWTEIKDDSNIIVDNTNGALGQKFEGTDGTIYYGEAVAQIVGKDDKYPTLADALNHVAEGETIKLLANATVSSAIVINAKNVTIDGDKHEINVIANIADNLITAIADGFTLQNVTINTNGKVTKSAVHFYNTTNGNITGAAINGGGYTSILVNGAEVTVKDSTLNPDKGAYANIEYGAGPAVTIVPKLVVDNVSGNLEIPLVYAEQSTIDKIKTLDASMTDASAIDKTYVIGANLQVGNEEAETYTITFNPNGGTLADDEKEATTNEHGKLDKDNLPTPERSRHRFDGWFTEANGGTEVDENTVFESDTTIYAHWTRTSSGGGSSHRYDGYITIIDSKNGDVSVSDTWADEDDKITLTITPDKGYEVDKIEIVDDEGDKIDAKKVEDKDNKYTFRMANCDVTVTVTFKEEGKTTEDTDKEEDKDDETTENTGLNFTDVSASDWFFKGVEYVVDKGIMSGVSENQFDPSGKLTRAMLVQMLYNMESRPACDAANAFIDVPVGQWYTDAVIWANDAKIVSGMGEGLFAPNMEITREQMVAMLYNYAKYKGYDVTASADLSAFADSASVSAWAQPAMQWAVAEGYISGMGDNQLAPQGTATRAEIASVIMRFMEATAESAETAE